MGADNIEFSGDRRFRLFYWDEERGGQTIQWIRLEHAPTSTIVLDLTDDGCNVESYRFSEDGKLLHLKVGRVDRSLVGYPATLDLETGLYYHHPQPHQSHGPAGRAEDLETIARTGRPGPDYDPERPVRWPRRKVLDWSEEPGARVSAVNAAAILSDVPGRAEQVVLPAGIGPLAELLNECNRVGVDRRTTAALSIAMAVQAGVMSAEQAAMSLLAIGELK